MKERNLNMQETIKELRIVITINEPLHSLLMTHFINVVLRQDNRNPSVISINVMTHHAKQVQFLEDLVVGKD